MMNFQEVEEGNGLMVNGVIYHVGDCVKIIGKHDWGSNIETVIGYIQSWDLEDAPAWDTHAGICIKSLYNSYDYPNMTLETMVSISRWEVKR